MKQANSTVHRQNKTNEHKLNLSLKAFAQQRKP